MAQQFDAFYLLLSSRGSGFNKGLLIPESIDFLLSQWLRPIDQQQSSLKQNQFIGQHNYQHEHSMQTPNTLYYHSHITQNINHIDQRTYNYIRHRKDFLRQYCSPLENKIAQLEREVKFFRHLIDNQNEMIENQTDVARLKTEIVEFKNTQTYFLIRIHDYQQRILELNVENEVIERQISKLKLGLTQLTLLKSHQIYNEFHSERLTEHKNFSSNKQSRSVIKSSIANKTLAKNGIYINQHQHDYLLPTIFKVNKYYDDKRSDGEFSLVSSTGHQGNLNAHEVNQSLKGLIGKSADKQTVVVADSRIQLQKKQLELKLKLKQHANSFNKFQILFKECFQKKKAQVQKSVSQLQSSLISDREKFLQICQAIGQKDLKKIGFNQFETLTGDELMTLFISFPWIQKRVFKQLNQRRKLTVQLVQLQRSKY